MLETINKIKSIIKNRPCVVIAKGRSIEQLEKNIEQLKNYDICWVGQNRVNYIEEGILEKIEKKFDLLSDCATVHRKSFYEPNHRLPRFQEFLSRENNLLMTSELVLDECFRRYGKDVLDKYKDKIVTIDSLVFGENLPKKLSEPPPNSLTLLLCFLIAGQAKKIILCGVDGFTNNNIDIFETYYKPNVAKEERTLAFEGSNNFKGSIPTDSRLFNERFLTLLELYKEVYKNKDVKIINCSENSIITIFKKISYNDLTKELE